MTRVRAATGLLVLASCVEEHVVDSYGGFGGYNDGGAGGCSLDCGLGGYDLGGAPPVEPPDCYDESAAVIIPEATFDRVAFAQGLCDDQQITDAYYACVGTSTASVEACEAFEAADPLNEPCLHCLLPGGTSPSPLPVVLQSEGYPYLTLWGCQAQATDRPECAVPIESLVYCGRAACATCADDDATNACVDYTIFEPGPCNELLPAGCLTVLGVTAFDPVCVGEASAFKTTFDVLAALYCGMP